MPTTGGVGGAIVEYGKGKQFWCFPSFELQMAGGVWRIGPRWFCHWLSHFRWPRLPERVDRRTWYANISERFLMRTIKLFENDTTKNPVVMDVFDPPTGVTPLGKSVVVAYGTDGLSVESQPLLYGFCGGDLANAGYTTVLPHYFEATKTTPGFKSVPGDITTANLKLWTDAIVAAVAWCTGEQKNDKVALIGFSLGGYMAARAALATPVKALVDFFGPMTRFGTNPKAGLIPYPTDEEITEDKAKALPTTQIHHGTMDLIVVPSESALLASWRQKAGKPVDLHDKYVCGHPQQPELPWTLAAQSAATIAVLKFLGHAMP
jgi:dienelactone hydrolase